MTVDLFGEIEQQQPFKDIRNQRESVAEEKARLCQELNTLLRSSPSPAAISNIEKTRSYKRAHKIALKVLQNKASSRQELSSAVAAMQAWVNGA